MKHTAKAINIEASDHDRYGRKQLVPAVINYTTDLASSMGTVLDVCPDATWKRPEGAFDGILRPAV